MSRSFIVAFSLLTLAPCGAAPAQSTRGYYRSPAVHASTVVFAAEGDLWIVPLAGWTARRLTTHHGEETRPAISPDGKILAFNASYEGPSEVYTMPLSGGLPTRRTWEGGGARVVGFTPQGRLLYTTRFFSTLPNNQLATIDLESSQTFLVPLAQAADGVHDDSGNLYFARLAFNGSQTRRYKGGTQENLWRFGPGNAEAVPLTADYDGVSRDPMWYRDRLYFASDRDGIMNIWSMAGDGSDLQQHTEHTGFDVLGPSLSRGFIVYQYGCDLWRYDIESDQSSIIDITLESDYDQMRENWVTNPMSYLTAAHVSPDGDRVTLTARGEVFVAPAGAGRLAQITRRPGVRYRDARFLPDGETLLVLSDESGELEFWTFPADGLGAGEQVTDNGSVLRWEGIPSPDGRYIAHDDKNWRLWILDTETGDERMIDESNMGNFSDVTWSPDSRWVAYSRAEDNQYGRLWMYNATDDTRVALTSDRVLSSSPAWSPDGEWLYFLSDRQLRTDVFSPWGPWAPQPHFEKTTELYMLALQPGLRSPFRPDDELNEESDDDGDEKGKPDAKGDGDDADENGEADGEDEGDEDEDEGVPPLEIELEGLPARLHKIPVPNGDYRNLMATKDRLLWLAAGDSGRNLMMLKIDNEKPEAKKLVEGVRSVELSADRKKILLRKGNALHVIDAKTGAPANIKETAIDLRGWAFSLDPREEWRQMFIDAWRLERDYFYDQGMHGVDWDAALAKYQPLADRVTTRNELGDAIAQMVAELSALHTFVRGGDQRSGDDQVQPASLGALLTRDNGAGGYRVARVFRSDPEYPDELGPLARPGVDVHERDVIEMINGVATLDAPDIAALLRNQAGRQVRLRVRPDGADESHDVIVTPISSRAASNLRYTDWEYSRRLAVEAEGDGELGYVHLRAMGAGDINQWTRDFFPVHNRKGLIIDVRHNRGGNIDSWVLGQLLRKAWFYFQGRVGDPTWNMQYAFRGHMVILCNERTASDGEAITEGFMRLGLGPSIGTRTWGGEIWLTSSNVLVDRGIATAAEFGVYGPEGIWLIEGHGVEPDIVVDNLPHATFNGEDAQLAAAIEYLKRKIEAEPVDVPAVPAHPDKSFDR